jgi:geranylgeranyl pyrophosphate synthase
VAIEAPKAFFDSDTIQAFTSRVEKHESSKKIKQLLKAHAKKASAKLAPLSKSKYISKADRLKLAAESSHDTIISSEN